MTALVLFPLALAVFCAGGAVMWPVARRIERHALMRDDFDYIPRTLPEPVHPIADDYPARHRWDDETVIGCATQARRRAALREPTAEFKLIVSANYRSGDWPQIGRPPLGTDLGSLSATDRPADLPDTPSPVDDPRTEVLAHG